MFLMGKELKNVFLAIREKCKISSSRGHYKLVDDSLISAICRVTTACGPQVLSPMGTSCNGRAVQTGRPGEI